jgi:hypothetical protein
MTIHRRARPLPLALFALASLGAARALSAQVAGPVVRFPAYELPISLDTLAFGWEQVSATRVATHRAVRAGYAALKIKLEFEDPNAGVLGMMRFRAPKRLAGERLSRYFDCGRGTMGSNADVMRVTVAAATYLRERADGTMEFGTSMVAQAQDMSGGSTAPVRCGSLGTLEKKIADATRAALAGGAP